MGEIILTHPGGASVITEVLMSKREAGGAESQEEM